MRDLSVKFEACPPAISDYTEFFGQLRNRFDPGICNLNYDTVTRNAWPDACFGFDHRGTSTLQASHIDANGDSS